MLAASACKRPSGVQVVNLFGASALAASQLTRTPRYVFLYAISLGETQEKMVRISTGSLIRQYAAPIVNQSFPALPTLTFLIWQGRLLVNNVLK